MAHRYGFYYTSLNHGYRDDPTSHFALFQQNRINLIGLQLHWSAIEPNTQGNYQYVEGGDLFLNRVINVCNLARDYGIEVDVDFHTNSGGSKTYGLPSWVTNFDQVLTTYRQAFINMEKFTVQTLQDNTTNIRSIHLFNEPPIVVADDYYSLFSETAIAVKQVTTKPIALRDGPNHVTSTWQYYPWDNYDFWCQHFYLDQYNQTKQEFVTSVNAMRAKGLRVDVTEYGWDTGHFGSFTADPWGAGADAEQQTKVREMIKLFKGQDTAYPIAPIENTEFTQFGFHYYDDYCFNLRNYVTGNLRPSFYDVAGANTWTSSVVLPYHNPLATLDNLQVINGTWSVS